MTTYYYVRSTGDGIKTVTFETPEMARKAFDRREGGWD